MCVYIYICAHKLFRGKYEQSLDIIKVQPGEQVSFVEITGIWARVYL